MPPLHFPLRTAASRKRPIHRKSRRPANCRRGTLTIEMAIVAPFILFLVFTSIEFSRMMMMKQALQNAAREGARKAALVTSQNSSAADAVVRNLLGPTMRSADDKEILRVNFVYPANGSVTTGDKITTNVNVDCADVSWALGPFFGQASIGATVSMFRE